MFKESNKSMYKQLPDKNICSFMISNPINDIEPVKCNNRTIPLSDYCRDRKLLQTKFLKLKSIFQTVLYVF